MSHDTFDSKESIEHKSGGDMRIFIFKSEAKPDLRAFGGDLAGIKLPGQFKPWRAVGAIAPNQEPPYKRLKPFCDELMWQRSEPVKTSMEYRS
jgi:hypothetical protein